jgi:minor histocompatibility antigen H13
LKFDWIDVLIALISVGIGLWYITSKHWIANNVLGLAFSIQGIALLALGSYKVGCILLVCFTVLQWDQLQTLTIYLQSGLFFYDIFWVFATPVMVSVAKSLDAPVKLLFPKNVFDEEPKFSMLGLGDIVIPGIITF